MLPFLEREVDLSREYADYFAPYDHIADPLIDNVDEGMTKSLRKLFRELRDELVPIVRTLSSRRRAAPKSNCASSPNDPQRQVSSIFG